MSYSVRFSLGNDAIVRNLQGEEVTLESIKNCKDYPIWGILLVVDREGHLAIRQLCGGEIKIKNIHTDPDISNNINLSRKIARSQWDTEFTIGEGNSLVSLIWSESYTEPTKVFDIVAVWKNGGFAFFNGQKDFDNFTIYDLRSTAVYDVDFDIDIEKVREFFPQGKNLHPCIPYVQTLEGQDSGSYSVHYFKGVKGTLRPTFGTNRSFSDSELLLPRVKDEPIRPKGKRRRRKRSERLVIYPNQ